MLAVQTTLYLQVSFRFPLKTPSKVARKVSSERFTQLSNVSIEYITQAQRNNTKTKNANTKTKTEAFQIFFVPSPLANCDIDLLVIVVIIRPWTWKRFAILCLCSPCVTVGLVKTVEHAYLTIKTTAMSVFASTSTKGNTVKQVRNFFIPAKINVREFSKICKACCVHCSMDHCAGVQFLVSHFLATAMRQSGLRKWMEFSCWACWISSHSWLLYQDDSYCRLLLFCCGNFKVYYLPSSSQRKTRFPLQFFFSNFCGK